ncbi:VOC family protein [Kordia sp.]|uniref:VOC family protein n=1 Tax=Kordia sp. TaxID=1965332 RepID=UPI003B5CF5F3
MNIQNFTLQIFQPEKTLAFYTNVLGFRVKETFTSKASTYYNLYLNDSICHLQLKHTPSLEKMNYQQMPTDNYWKYSIFVDDIQKAYKELQQQQYQINEPFQFGDIGYLAHTTDVENHQIEFIQKTFKQNSPTTKDAVAFKENSSVLGLLTIRTKDPLKSIAFYENILDLKLYVRMYVNRGKGFTLYFLADKNLQAPNADIDAIENREWMYQQQHLFVEIQHYWNSEYDSEFMLNSGAKNGLQQINFSGNNAVLKEKLTTNMIAFREETTAIVFETPDKHVISCENI